MYENLSTAQNRMPIKECLHNPSKTQNVGDAPAAALYYLKLKSAHSYVKRQMAFYSLIDITDGRNYASFSYPVSSELLRE